MDITDFSTEFMDEMFNNFEGKEIYGILAACPCTTFSNSGTRWRKDRHENADPVESRKIIEQMWGKEAAEAVDPETGEYTYATAHDYAIALVDKTMQTLEYLRPKFWALENPEGRIETSAGLPGPWRTGFQPHNFGEPYTKRTLLWGEFNENLPTANVEPTEGSKMHKMSPSETRQAERSETPAGFSYAFFMANNYLDKSPLERTKADYWYVEGAIEEAFKAGVTEDEIRANIELDQSYEPADIEGTLEAIRELINKKPPSTPGTPTTPPSDKGGPKRGFGPAWGIPDEAEIDAAANEAAPDEATDAQKEAGNYKKGHISIAGFDVTIENPAGTVRHGNLKLRDHYGYIKRTKGADSGQIDVFVNSKAAEDFTGDIYVVDQIDPKTGKFDEHKVMLGYNNQLDARRAYKRNYNKDWKGAGNIVKMTLEEFKAWLDLPGVNDQPARYAPTGPDSPAFKEWFGNSKVVDKKGKPIVVYHGTQSKEEFNIFEPKASFGGWNNVGTWFSDTPKHAEVFTWISRQDGKSGQMIPAYVRIEKPWIVEWDRLQEKIEEVIARHNAKTGEKLDRYGGKELKQRVTSKVGLVLRKALQDQGYDGLILENWTGDGPPAQNVYVAFEPEQIKSAIGNRGTYDIMNKDIRYASGRELTGAPTKQWLEKVLAGGEKRMGDLPDTVPLNVAVSELLKLQQQRQALDAGQPVPVTPVRPTLQEVQKAIAPVEKAMPGAPVEVLANYKQAPKLVRDRMSADGMTQVRAVFDPQTGKIYLFADQARDANDAVMTALHEKAHLGLRKAFGDRLNPLLDDIFMNVSERRRADMQKIADQYRLDVGKLDDRRTIAEELLAHMAEHDVKDGIVNRAIAFIRKALRSMGFTQKFSDNDIRALIREAQGSITRGPSRTAGITLEEEVVLDETGEVFIVEREADQILTGLDQRIMICERIRDCV